MKFKFNYLILAAFLTANFSAKAIPTPEAVEPQYDDDGNPIMYTIDGRPIFINNKRGYPGPFVLGLFPYFHMSPHYH